MPSSVHPVIALAACLAPAAAAAATPEEDFAARCAATGVVKCVGFDDAATIQGPTDYTGDPAPFGLVDDGDVTPRIDGAAASGGGSLLFTIPSNSGSSFGAYFTNFSDDFSVQFGVGDDFYVQWRQRFSPELLDTIYYEDYAAGDVQGGWKQVIIGEGDRAATNIYSCTDLEIVVNDGMQRGFAQMYHSCGAKDGQYEGLAEPFGDYDFLLQNALRDPACSYHNPTSPPCVGYVPDRWMTFQVHVHVGTPYDNDGEYKHDSTIQLWIADEGAPSTLVIDERPMDPACAAQQTSQPGCQTGYDLFNDNPAVRKYGQVWLLPYMTRKDPAQPHPTAYTWYDELIVSRQPIADPMGVIPPGSGGGGGGADADPGPDAGGPGGGGPGGGCTASPGGGGATTALGLLALAASRRRRSRLSAGGRG